MEYRKLPHGEEQISIIGMGSSVVGEQSEDDIIETVQFALDAGINFFDMAGGHASIFSAYGKALQGRRKDAMLQVHFGANYTTGAYGWTTNLDTVKKSVEWQLERLKTDYIDIYFLHRDDETKPVEEIMPVLDDFVKSGRVHFLGASNWTTERIEEANRFAVENGLEPFRISQIYYSLAHTSKEAIGDETIACMDMKSYMDGGTLILPLLNSVTPTPAIQQYYPDNKVLYGYISKIDAYNNNDGSGFYYNVAGDIHFGYANNEHVAPELEKIRDVLVTAGFTVNIDVDMMRGIWKKWMLNVGANQVSALTEANYIQFSKIKEIHHILRLAMQELLIIASYEGVNLSTGDINETLEYLTTYPYPKKTSMLQDIQAHRRTEVDYISGDVIKLAHKWNCPSPVNLTMYYLIKAKEATYL